MTFVDKYPLGRKQSTSSLLAVSEPGSYVKNVELWEQFLCIQKRLKNVGQKSLLSKSSFLHSAYLCPAEDNTQGPLSDRPRAPWRSSL